jgi:DNA invertase Pin-like site-specific DNA recombinase
MQVTAYLRVSTAEQTDSGAGLGAQRAAILAEVERRGWQEEDVEWIEDAGFSATNTKRPGLAQALDLLARGEAAVLMVSRVDRLSRSVLDFAGVMQRAQKEGWALVALDSPADLTTPQGGLMANVMIAFAEFERLLIGQRTKEALAVKKAQGVRLGRPPAIPMAVVHRIVAERRSGRSWPAIAEGLNADDVPTAHGGAAWWPATVRKIALRAA